MSNATRDDLSLFIWRAVLLLAMFGLLLFFLLAKSCGVTPDPSKVAALPKIGTDAVGSLGNFLSFKLPDGTELNIPELGVEKRLIIFIQDGNRQVDKTTWFTFDRLEFETGSATLKASSDEQLQNMAYILKAFPHVAIKIGGYTDNTGTPETNVKLSRERALNTLNVLVSLGVDAARMEAEGYGQEHPVADNATAEGRQKNRRIDFRVTAK